MPTYLISLAVVWLALLVLWLVSVKLRDASIIDAFWGAGFVVVAWTVWQLHPSTTPRVLLLVVLISIWGLRLSLFLLWRKLHHRDEDHRYAAMRTHHGQRFWWVSLFTVFLLQGVILWFVALPVQVAARYGDVDDQAFRWGLLDASGVALWLLGLFFEAVGDWQLARFKADPANQGRVMDRGLWRYTRHPNYFGDCCVWWGIYLIATAGGAGLTIGSPLLMSLLLMRVSGVTLLESTIIDRRPAYAAYQARTNAFFPGPPKAQGKRLQRGRRPAER